MLTAVGFVSTQSAPAPRWVQLPSSSLSAPGAHFSSRLVFSRRAVRWCCALALGLFYFFFIKLRYKGKSYKWHRRRGALVLRFGYSHTALSYIPRRVFVRRAGKMKMVFFGTCLWELRSLLAGAIRWRPMNVYNGRGLRFARQLVFRKFGKVSAYR